MRNLLALALILCSSLWISCNTAQQKSADLNIRCCQECREAFNQSPVGVGAAGVNCGEFSSGQPISQLCLDYFKDNPMTVAECE